MHVIIILHVLRLYLNLIKFFYTKKRHTPTALPQCCIDLLKIIDFNYFKNYIYNIIYLVDSVNFTLEKYKKQTHYIFR